MKKKKVSSTIFFIVALLFYLVAIIIACGNNDVMPAVWMCLGTTFLCLGFVYNKKGKEDSKKEQ